MIESFKEWLLVGLGATSLTRERAERVFNELVNQGRLNADEARGYVEELTQSGERQWREHRAQFADWLKELLAEMGLAKQSELEVLARRIEELECQLAAAGQAGSTPSSDATRPPRPTPLAEPADPSTPPDESET